MVRGSMARNLLVVAVGATAVQGQVAETSCPAGGCDESSLLQFKHSKEARKVATLTQPLVDEVYTFGAPSTHKTPLRNAAREDGCFVGLRSYTENLAGAFNEITQADGGALFKDWPHAYISTVTLRKPGDESIFSPCPGPNNGHPEWPQRVGQVYDDWTLHGEPNYQERLDGLVLDGKAVAKDVEPFASARMFRILAWRAYETLAQNKKAVDDEMPEWEVVGKSDDKHGPDIDPVVVVQNQKTLDCALVFTGTNSLSEFSTSTTQYGTGFCGYEDVHAGYRNELWTITKNLWYSIRPKLNQCNKVTCVGHSLGGALCELFSACANSGNFTDPDYQQLVWNKRQQAKDMPEAQVVDPPRHDD